MAINSKIEWTGSTWNPIRARLKEDTLVPTKKDPLRVLPAGTWGYHCERISPGCCNCYACSMNGRTLPAWGTGLDYTVPNRDKVEIFLDEEELLKPLHWKKGRKIFPCSMTDLFGEFVADEMIDRVFAVMALCPQHTFQVLTKRAKRMREYFADLAYRTEVIGIRAEYESGLDRHQWAEPVEDTRPTWPLPLPNVHLGVSVEDQQRADERIPELLATPAAVRFLSVEPLLGLVDLKSIRVRADRATCRERYDALCGKDRREHLRSDGTWDHRREGDDDGDPCWTGNCLPKLDGVIVGGESGPDARPMHSAWARSLRDQCVGACVPFFFKQWGEFLGPDQDGAVISRHQELNCSYAPIRVGKKVAGRLLDGREWNELPSASGVHSSMEASPSLDCSTKKDLA